jgi:hypothetical protein
LDKHYGINELTSYKKVSYQLLQENVRKKQQTSGKYKALLLNKKDRENELKKLLLAEHKNPGRSNKRTARIAELDQRIKDITEEIAQTQKE